MRRSGNLKKAVFLDRDGVISQALIDDGRPYSPRKKEELFILTGVSEAVELLLSHGYLPVVVTNQPDIARGFTTFEHVSEMHKIISNRTGLQHFYVCVHDEQDKCQCRKPKTGMLTNAARELSLNLNESFLVGDRWKDIQAGQNAGCHCFFIDNGYLEKRPEPPFHTVVSLLEAASYITEGKC
jgi:D-glycero-D-manno-heptose 1,7-bisphosphate phosphatase